MAIHITSPEAVDTAHQLAAKTGESIERAVTIALRQELRRANGMQPTAELRMAATLRIVEEIKQLPVLDDRPMDEILGYDDDGMPA